MKIDLELLAKWLKDRKTNNCDSNSILDGLEELFKFETKLNECFKETI